MCWCSGVTSDCERRPGYWSEVSLAASDTSPTFTITDRSVDCNHKRSLLHVTN